MRSITSRAFELIPCISNACTLECAQRSHRQPQVHAWRRTPLHAVRLRLSPALCHRCSRATCEQQRCSCEHRLARTIAAQGLCRRRAQMRAPHSLPDSASMPIAWREVEGSDLRPRLPSWRLVWLTQVWCVSLSVSWAATSYACTIKSCMECEQGMRPRVRRKVRGVNGRIFFYWESRRFYERSILGSSRGAQNWPYRLCLTVIDLIAVNPARTQHRARDPSL